MDHVTQGRHVVGSALCLWELEHPVKHGGNHVRLGYLVLVDTLQTTLGRPFVDDDHGVAEVERKEAESHHSGVVKRCGDQMHVVVLRLHVEEHQEHPLLGAALVRVLPGQCTFHPFRLAGRSGRIGHNFARLAIVRRRHRLALHEILEGPEPGNVSKGEPCFFGKVQLLCNGYGVFGKAFRSEEGLGIAVVHDVSNLVGSQVPVDGRNVDSGLRGPQCDCEHGDRVAGEQGDRVPTLKTEVAKSVDHLVGKCCQLSESDRTVVSIHDRDLIRVLLCHLPKSEFTHAGPPDVK